MGNGSVTKDRILQTALGLFARNGFEGARMEKLAAEVGINKASLYFHFKSKEDLFRALFQQILHEYKEALQAILSETKTLPVKERLTAIYEKYLDYNWNNTRMEFWNRMYYFPPQMMRDEIVKSTLDTESFFIAELAVIMEESIRRKELRPLDAVHMAKSYYYVLTCIGLSADLMDKAAGLKEMKDCFEVFWEGVKAI
jgi:AcrR family transcriptional regulator